MQDQFLSQLLNVGQLVQPPAAGLKKPVQGFPATMGAVVEPDAPVDVTPFHPGEQQMQLLTGARSITEQLGRQWIAPTLSPQAAEFFRKQSFLFTGTKDAEGCMWASVLAGSPGFMTSPDNKHLKINNLRMLYQDPAPFRAGDHIGTVAIELHTRRRQRLNGTIAARDADSLTFHIDQCFSGCPKYIQAREVGLHAEAVNQIGREPRRVTRGEAQLGDHEKALIARSDTFFLATTYDQEITDSGIAASARGHDVSHRGGAPGFAQVVEDAEGSIVRWADYLGNFTFTTLGNIHSNPASGLIFVDFDSGDTLQITGRSQILFDDHSLPGAERVIQVQNHLKLLQNNYVSQTATIKYLTCLSVRDETPDVRTYQFMAPQAARGEGLWPYKAGQYASFDFEGIAGPEGRPQRTINRTWTLSSHPSVMAQTGAITISVKKMGLVSKWLWSNLKRGTPIAFRGIEGHFTADVVSEATAPVLLIAGGIGITPLRAMLHEFCCVRGADTVLLYAREVLICGPSGFMQSVQACLESLHFPLEKLHMESFTF
ncbi:hypothetical protein WJX72_005632 [[Myrmecia] bisecta]|uniref:FAD-binding FR-type domain-containing protein n=1 Tax=[Myrmecia] bisecta TaxID=41462 RepID=A0AAW1PWA9_9CHLO